MKALFLVEAGGQYGLGHLVRCSVLADALRARRAEVRFAVRRGARHLPDWFTSDTPVIDVDNPGAAEALVMQHAPGWVVVDGYGLLTDGVVRRLRTADRRVLAFDDFGNDGGGADLVVNQNVSVDATAQRDARRLLGPHYAIVAPAYAANRTRGVSASLQRILLTFGGSDVRGLTPHALRAFKDVPDSLSLDVVVGPYHRTSAFEISGRHRLTVHTQPHGLAALLATADLVISAAGSTCWEICCAGVPLIAVQTADNQREVMRCLTSRSCALTLPAEVFLPTIESGGLPALIDRLRDAAKREAMVTAQRQLVDGKGAGRIVSAMGFSGYA